MSSLASKAAKVASSFHDTAAVAGGCGCGAGPSGPCQCQPGTFPPGKTPASAVPMVGKRGNGAFGTAVEPLSDDDTFQPPLLPYVDEKADARYMTYVVGEATIAGGASTQIDTQPSQGWFDMFYLQIIAIDDANPQSRQRVSVGRFSVGDCPGDCRTVPIFSDAFEPDYGCCNGRPMRARFTRTALGGQLSVTITNLNSAGSVRVQVIAKGYCNRGSCAC